VPVGSTARVHGKETRAATCASISAAMKVRLGPLVGEHLAKDFASARRNWLQRTWARSGVRR